MKIISRDTMNLIREEANGRCSWCRRKCDKTEVHHIIKRGMGGGSRLDVRCNLVALCGPRVSGCHYLADCGKIDQDSLFAVVAHRDRCLQHHIKGFLHWLLRLPKYVSSYRLGMAIKLLDGGEVDLAIKTFTEQGIEWE